MPEPRRSGLIESLGCIQLFVTPRTTARQAPLSMGFPRLECGSELPFPSPGDLPDPGIEPTSPACQADSSSLSHLGRSKSPVTRERGEKRETPGPLRTLPRGVGSVDGRVGREARSLEKDTRAVCRAPISSRMQLRGLLVLESPTLSAHPACLRSRKAQRTGHGKVLEACFGCSTLRAEQALGKFLISLSSTEIPR